MTQHVCRTVKKCRLSERSSE